VNHSAAILTFLILVAGVHAQGTFRNLDFESAQLPPVPRGQSGGFVSAVDGIPGWIPYYNSGPNLLPGSSLSHNGLSLGGAALFIHGPDDFPERIIEGDYSVELVTNFYCDCTSVGIGQTGQLPPGVETLLVSSDDPLGVQISFDGRLLQFSRLGSRTNHFAYGIYGADISLYAGKIGELRLLATGMSRGLIDDIRFGFLPVGGRDPDALEEWTTKKVTDATIWDGVFTGDGFILVSAPPNSFLKSPNGVDWTAQNVGEEMRSLVFGGELYVAGSSSGKIYASTDSENWQIQTTLTTNAISKLIYGQGVFVALDAGGNVFRSTNGSAWKLVDAVCCVTSITYSPGLFLAGAGQSGASSIFTSTNALDWTERFSSTTNSALGAISTITYGNGNFVALGESKLLTSTDGSDWQPQPFTAPLRPIAFSGGLFFGLDNGHLATSRDGINWIVRKSTTADISDVVYGADRYIAFGPNGTILRSDDLNTVLTIERTPGFSRINYRGVYQRVYTLQGSTNLVDWLDLRSAPNVLGTSLFLLPDTSPLKFYRTVLK
jgi:hypothetical protein